MSTHPRTKWEEDHSVESRTGFSLSKWYLDSVDDSGNLLIGYSTALRWNFAHLHNTSILQAYHDQVLVDTSASNCPPVFDENGKTVRWTTKKPRLNGTWLRLASPIVYDLLESEEGNVRWSCLQPSSRVTVEQVGRPVSAGMGYVELLEMSIKPWKLPIDELRWGRFVSESQHITWIVWRGEHPINLVFHNGAATTASISKDRVEVGNDYVLEISEHLTLREGSLGATTFASLSELRSLLPNKITRIHETKWRSKGTLRQRGQRVCDGWVIHEVVQF